MKNANPVSRLAVGALLLLSVGLVACAKDKSEVLAAGNSAAVKSGRDFFPIGVGGRVVRMQLAVRPAEMQRGLMQRTDLGPDDGMIFIYEKAQQMHYWMRNTPTPLDIGFFNERGVLQEVYPLHPFDESTVSSRGTQLQYALETNQGWFRANGVQPGAQLDLKALGAALRERGFDPRRYAIQP